MFTKFTTITLKFHEYFHKYVNYLLKLMFIGSYSRYERLVLGAWVLPRIVQLHFNAFFLCRVRLVTGYGKTGSAKEYTLKIASK